MGRLKEQHVIVLNLQEILRVALSFLICISNNVNCDRPVYHHDEFKLQRYGEEEQKGSDQQLSLHFPPTKGEQFTFNIDISEGNQHHFNFQLKHCYEEVFLCDIYDPIENYLESMSSIYVKVFLSDESWLYHLFKPLFCWLCIPLFFGSRSRIGSVNQFLIWLHWKHELT
jgi:hypothetical protein